MWQASSDALVVVIVLVALVDEGAADTVQAAGTLPSASGGGVRGSVIGEFGGDSAPVVLHIPCPWAVVGMMEVVVVVVGADMAVCWGHAPATSYRNCCGCCTGSEANGENAMPIEAACTP